MYGLVNLAIQELVCSKFGVEKWHQVCELAGTLGISFHRMQSYPDALTYKLVGGVSQVCGITSDEALVAFGEFFEREQLALVDAIAVTNHHALLVIEDREPFAHQLFDFRALYAKVGGDLLLVRERLADRQGGVDIERRVERGGVLAEREDAAHLLDRLA